MKGDGDSRLRERVRALGATTRAFALQILDDLVGPAVRSAGVLPADPHTHDSAHLAAVAEASDDAIIGKTLDGRVTSWNRGAQSLFGYTRDEMVGQPIQRLVPPERAREESAILAAAARGEVTRLDTVRRRKDGQLVAVAVTTSPIRDRAGRVVGISKVARDITERLRAQEAEQVATRRIGDERLRAVTDSAGVGLVLIGEDRCYRYANRSYVEMMRLPSPDIVGKRVADVLHVVYEGQIRGNLDRAFGGERVSVEVAVPGTPELEPRYYSAWLEPSTEGGAPIVVVVVVEITERKRVLEALALREEQLRLFIAHSPVALAMFDRDMRYVAASRQWLTAYGLPEAGLVGRSHYDVFPSIPERWKEAHRRCLAGAIEHCDDDAVVRPDGQAVRLRWDIHPWRTLAGEVGGIVIFTEDIGVRKRAEQALRDSEERFRELAENIRDVFWVTDASKTTMLYVSPAYEAMWGRSRDALYASPADWLEALHPQDRARVELRAKGRSPGEAYQETYRIVHPDGAVRWIHDRGFPVRDASGEVVRIVGLASDLTKERTLEDQFRQAQKMEAMGRLAGGVAHDFNNMLSIVISYTDLLLEAVAPEDPMHADIEEIRRAGQRATDLTRQLLQFSRQQVIEPRVVDIDDVLSGMRKMLGRLIGEDIDLQLKVHPVGNVRLDPGGLEQVVMNLAVNARDAMPTGGTLTIETRGIMVDESYAGLHAGLKPGRHVAIRVTDTGCGMDEATRSHVFEPFFTTKAKGKGTGLGLSTVFGIVAQSGGGVRVESRPGAGTMFEVVLPCVDAELESPRSSLLPTTLRGTETILVAEDDDQLRAVVVNVLRRQGYQVLPACNGLEALARSAEHDGEIHLLLTDVVMPHMSGPELARQLADTRPGTRVLCVSGYTDDSMVRHGVFEARFAFLQKPVSPEKLARKVREVLDGPRAQDERTA